jgi:hypothetical protein
MGKNTFLLDFEHHWEKEMVMEGRLWVFEGNLFSVVEFDPHTNSMDLNFNNTELWVRIFKLS